MKVFTTLRVIRGFSYAMLIFLVLSLVSATNAKLPTAPIYTGLFAFCVTALIAVWGGLKNDLIELRDAVVTIKYFNGIVALGYAVWMLVTILMQEVSCVASIMFGLMTSSITAFTAAVGSKDSDVELK
jgi:sorbitol-specific phosphotransferase system component IIC